ncbi:MAG: phage minor head protein [Sphingomonadales bacterium]|jgi:SPP1 gp7 family putative phage head morphogenesis protein
MVEPVDLRDAFDLTPADALQFFRSKGYQISVDWTDVWQPGHARAFTVAKIAQYSLLEDVRRSLDEALANGETFESWKTRIVPILRQKGWWGAVTDQAVTGTTDTVNVTPRRLRVIYDTNLRTARAAGQWARIQAAKAQRPYLRYSAILDRRTRPEHRAWHGTVLPVDHPWWRTHFPPNGWFCRCNVQQLSERDLKRYGYQVSPEAPAGRPTLYRSSTGFESVVPPGVDPGFGNNPGDVFWASIAPRLRDDPISLPAISPAPGTLPELPPRSLSATELLDQFKGPAQGDNQTTAAALEAWAEAVQPYLTAELPAVIVDPTDMPIMIDQSVWADSRGVIKITKRGRARFLKLIARTMAEPDEVWHQWVLDNPDRRQPGTPPYPAYLLRKLIARFQVDGEDRMITVLLQVGDQGWQVMTAFAADKDSYFQRERSGTLAYRRS